MKTANINLTLIVYILFNSLGIAQVAKDSWSFGFGGTYPRFMGIWSKAYSGTANYGAFVSLKRNFSESVALRFLANYNYMEAIYDFPTGEETESVKMGTASLDLLYYLTPCDPVSPFVGLGFGGILFRPHNAFEKHLNTTALEYQMNLRAGAEWKINDDWKFITEASYITPSTNKLDGENNTHEHKGLMGTNCDTYMTFNFGFLYYFSKGDPSPKCDLYPGISQSTTSDNSLSPMEIERLIKENLPKEVVKEVIVEKPSNNCEKRWILVGVNFEFNSANLTKESFPILLNAIQILADNPDMNIEIIGHTDNIGSDPYNLKLSLRRAETVRNYLVANGISNDRLEVKGMGESEPIADNATVEGRTLNRRIEFRVKK